MRILEANTLKDNQQSSQLRGMAGGVVGGGNDSHASRGYISISGDYSCLNGFGQEVEAALAAPKKKGGA
jgi:hypothetical protein